MPFLIVNSLFIMGEGNFSHMINAVPEIRNTWQQRQHTKLYSDVPNQSHGYRFTDGTAINICPPLYTPWVWCSPGNQSMEEGRGRGGRGGEREKTASVKPEGVWLFTELTATAARRSRLLCGLHCRLQRQLFRTRFITQVLWTSFLFRITLHTRYKYSVH